MNTKAKIFLGLALIILLFYLSPYFFLGENSIIHPGDNLNSNLVWYKIIAESGKLFSGNYEIIPNMLNGVPRFCFGSEFDFIVYLYIILKPFYAYFLNLLLVHLIAFVGMFLLLRELIKNDISEIKMLIAVGVSLCFALLSFWSPGGLSISGQPLLAYSLLRINRNESRYYHWLVIILFPFYSGFILAGIFIIIVLAIIIIFDFFKNKNFPKNLFLSLILLCFLYILTNYRLFTGYFYSAGFISHRVEFYNPGTDVIQFFRDVQDYLVYGLASHANVFQFPVILIVSIIAFFSVKFKFKEIKNIKKLYIIILFISFISAIYETSIIFGLKSSVEILKIIDFSRFSFFLPVLYYVLFFYSVIVIYKLFRKKYYIYIIPVIFILQIFVLIKNNNNEYTVSNFINEKIFHKKDRVEITYREYYSVDLFSKIKDVTGIPCDSNEVICLGIEPGILQYNGFYTLDGYLPNYPLSYKHTFRTIIEKELEKNEVIKNVFDNWGSTCYLFSSELDYSKKNYYKTDNKDVNNLEINTSVIKQLGGRYLISGIRINNSNEINLELLNIFEDIESPYRIYLYKI